MELARVERIFKVLAERELLRVGPKPLRESGFDPSNTELARLYVKHENTIAASIHENKLSGKRLELAVRASDLGDIQPAVTEALERIGMAWEVFLDALGPSGVVDFVNDIPTRYVTNLMRSAKLRQNQQKWEPNDFNDILALPVAVVYCDVVVTEKQWAERFCQGKADRRFNTTLLSNTVDLVEVLAAIQRPWSV